MTERFAATRWVEIDAAHRVPDHRSKCRNLHGHRYRVEARVTGPLVESGSSAGMVMDFGEIKAALMRRVHDPADHATILYEQDPKLDQLLGVDAIWRDRDPAGGIQVQGFIGRVLVVPCVPTAEELARYWFRLIEPDIAKASDGQARLASILVRETPTSMAEWPIAG
jgi:6-pyruvoyltetrahydropterin/6-carboxytetrahydropterin synthase